MDSDREGALHAKASMSRTAIVLMCSLLLLWLVWVWMELHKEK